MDEEKVFPLAVVSTFSAPPATTVGIKVMSTSHK